MTLQGWNSYKHTDSRGQVPGQTMVLAVNFQRRACVGFAGAKCALFNLDKNQVRGAYMKQKYPAIGSNQLVGRNKFQIHSGAYESGARHHFYRSVILAVSGSIFCVAASEHAGAQSVNAPQASDQALGEAAQSSPPAMFCGLNVTDQTQWPSRPLEPASTPLYPAGSAPATNVDSSKVNVANAPAVSAAPGGADATPTLTLPGLPIQQPTVYKNEISASADFMYGTGTITVPVGYALKAASLPGASFPVNALSADRSTVYYGGTVSYSYGRSWYLDFSGENGRSTGSTGLSIPGLAGPAIPASFDVNDTWYQVYLRYNLQNFLAGTRFRAYLRGGVSLVSATLTTDNDAVPGSHIAPGGLYSEHDDTFDVLGNFGFGLTYSLYSTVRLKVGLQLEGEGFGGNRSQDITETFVPSTITGNTTINDTVYGAIGRLTVHADYRLGQSGRWKLTGDVGMMTKNSWVSYPDFGTKDETLYGPYVKAGASFVF